MYPSTLSNVLGCSVTSDRYFVDKFPMFFVPDSPDPTVVTFSFVDPELFSPAPTQL
jgi:hypothetical protein